MKSRRLPWLLLALVTTAALAALGDAPTDATVPVTAVANVAAVMPTIRALKSRAEIPGQGGDPFSATAPPAPLRGETRADELFELGFASRVAKRRRSSSVIGGL